MSDRLRTLYQQVRAGKDPDTGELHITEDEFVEALEAEVGRVESKAELSDRTKRAYERRIKELEDQLEVVQRFAGVIAEFNRDEEEIDE